MGGSLSICFFSLFKLHQHRATNKLLCTDRSTIADVSQNPLQFSKYLQRELVSYIHYFLLLLTIGVGAPLEYHLTIQAGERLPQKPTASENLFKTDLD